LTAAGELAGQVGVKTACAALGVARATFCRRRRPRTTGQRQPRSKPARALSEAERSEVFDVLCSPRFADRAPAEVYATLLDEGVRELGPGAGRLARRPENRIRGAPDSRHPSTFFPLSLHDALE